MKTVAVVILGAIFLITTLLENILRKVPPAEFKRSKNIGLYALSSMAPEAICLLFLISILSAVGVIVISSLESWWLALIMSLAIVWLLSSWLQPNMFLIKLGSFLVSPFIKVTDLLKPVLHPFSKLFNQPANYLIYEKDDLIDLLNNQSSRAYNHMSQADLGRAAYSLEFDDIPIMEVRRPKKQITWLKENDMAGPALMDELHKAGLSCYPVAKSGKDKLQVTGTFYTQDLLERLDTGARVSELTVPGVCYINESQKLPAALGGFLNSGYDLLITVNDSEEITGALFLEDVFKKLFGQKINPEPGAYSSPRAAANYTGDSQPGEPKVE